MGLRIRPASLDDAGAIGTIYNQGIEDRVGTLETELRTPAERRDWLESRGARLSTRCSSAGFAGAIPGGGSEGGRSPPPRKLMRPPILSRDERGHAGAERPGRVPTGGNREDMMEAEQIFRLQMVLSFVVVSLIAKWYVAPRLARLPLYDALVALIFLHAFRHLGMVFLVPAVVAPSLPSGFAVPTAYGDLVAGLLALLAIMALRYRWPLALGLAWLFNVVGTLDLLNAFYQGTRLSVAPHLGSAWYIPTFIVPALIVTHVMIFAMLVKRSR